MLDGNRNGACDQNKQSGSNQFDIPAQRLCHDRIRCDNLKTVENGYGEQNDCAGNQDKTDIIGCDSQHISKQNMRQIHRIGRMVLIKAIPSASAAVKKIPIAVSS